MIFSDKYRFLFFELPRTGTTSVRTVLLSEGVGVRYPGRRHLSISSYLKREGKFPPDYKVISSVRHPMDRVLSLYLKMLRDHNSYFSKLEQLEGKSLAQRRLLKQYRAVHKDQLSFERYFIRFYKWPYTDWMYRDASYCNFVLRFENLKEDYAHFARIIGLSDVPELPTLNKLYDKGDFWSYYTPATHERARWVFSEYMNRFNYSFPEHFGSPEQSIWEQMCFRSVDATYHRLATWIN